MTTTRYIDHVLTGDHASRPVAGDVPQGTVYACTDHGLIYQSDGVSTWSTWHDPADGAPGSHSHSGADITSGTVAEARIHADLARDSEVSAAVTGLLDFKGSTNASANPNYPAASKGDAYVISAAGKVGGASGVAVDVGDVYVASADNAGGTQASVGTSWFVLEHNLAGALLAANNLSDLASAATARTNLGLGTGDSPQLTAVNIGHATDTTVTRDAAGDIAVEGNRVYRAGGTDVPIADGGTGAGTAAAAFNALSPMTTQDDIIIGGASGAGARLGKGSDGQVLTVDPSTHHLVWATPGGGVADILDLTTAETDDTLVLAPDGAGGVEFRAESGGGGGGGLLAANRYATATTYTTTSTTPVDVDATNMAVTFTAPASGNVLVILSAYRDSVGGGGGNNYWGIREATTNLAGSVIDRDGFGTYLTIQFLITGLSAGSHTFKWAYAKNGGTERINVGVGTGVTVYGPAVMSVWEAP
jgi:hypothetical protein